MDMLQTVKGIIRKPQKQKNLNFGAYMCKNCRAIFLAQSPLEYIGTAVCPDCDEYAKQIPMFVYKMIRYKRKFEELA